MEIKFAGWITYEDDGKVKHPDIEDLHDIIGNLPKEDKAHLFYLATKMTKKIRAAEYPHAPEIPQVYKAVVIPVYLLNLKISSLTLSPAFLMISALLSIELFTLISLEEKSIKTN